MEGAASVLTFVNTPRTLLALHLLKEAEAGQSMAVLKEQRAESLMGPGKPVVKVSL